MHLVGLDIGFSRTRRSNALAEFENGELRIEKLSVPERDTKLRQLRDVDIIAIDAPIVPEGCSPTAPRLVEQLFCRGAFQKRCKPGASHVKGTGHQLREHGGTAAHLVAEATRWTTPPPFETVLPHCGVVEAFPNAFLGVALPDSAYELANRIPRGGKFDWLYDQWIGRGLFAEAIRRCGLPLELVTTLNSERDHDKRAALVCLLTAAFAATAQAVSIGDEVGGYFFLPSLDLWSGWAREALKV
jgi:predicted RNase H-like nuclease